MTSHPHVKPGQMVKVTASNGEKTWTEEARVKHSDFEYLTLDYPDDDGIIAWECITNIEVIQDKVIVHILGVGDNIAMCVKRGLGWDKATETWHVGVNWRDRNIELQPHETACETCKQEAKIKEDGFWKKLGLP